jgi:hypothetical protein
VLAPEESVIITIMKNKLIHSKIIILGVFILVLICIGLLVKQSQTPQTISQVDSKEVASPVSSNSQITTYKGQGITFNYPPGFVIKEDTTATSPEYPQGNKVINLYSADQLKNNETIPTITIGLAENSKNLTLDNALGGGPYLSYTDDFLKGKELKKIKVGGEEAVVVDLTNVGQAGDPMKDLIVIKDKKIYQLVLNIVNDQTLMIWDQVLGSFKFTQ